MVLQLISFTNPDKENAFEMLQILRFSSLPKDPCKFVWELCACTFSSIDEGPQNKPFQFLKFVDK